MKFRELVSCSEFELCIFSSDQNVLFTFSENEFKTLPKNTFEAVLPELRQIDDITFINKNAFNLPNLPAAFQSAAQIAAFSLNHENQLL